MIKIVILDDEEMYLEKERKITEEYFAENKTECRVTTYLNAEWFLSGLQEENYDVYILDMEMPGKKGMEVAREIRKVYPDPIIMFVTNYMNYAVEAYEVNTWRYIPKMALQQKLKEAFDALIPILMAKEERYYVIEKRGDLEKIAYSDIMYMQKEGKYVIITHRRGDSKVRKSLDTVMNELKSREFIMIEKGYIINLLHIMRMKDYDIYMRDGMVLPIGKKRMSAVREAIVDYWGDSIC